MAREKKLTYDRSHFQFTKEQKVKVVQEIEAGQLTRKEAMEKYNIVGHQTLKSWLLQYGTKSSDVISRKRYSKADQRLAAYKIATGESTADEVAREMQVGVTTVYKWSSLYRVDLKQTKDSSTNTKPQAQSTSSDKAQQKEIEELRLKIAGLEMMIDIAEKDLKIDIRKKSGTKQ